MKNLLEDVSNGLGEKVIAVSKQDLISEIGEDSLPEYMVSLYRQRKIPVFITTTLPRAMEYFVVFNPEVTLASSDIWDKYSDFSQPHAGIPESKDAYEIIKSADEQCKRAIESLGLYRPACKIHVIGSN